MCARVKYQISKSCPSAITSRVHPCCTDYFFPTSLSVLYRVLLRGTIVNRTYGIQKNYIFTNFYQQYLVLLTMVPRNSFFRLFASYRIFSPHPFIGIVSSSFFVLSVSYRILFFVNYRYRVVFFRLSVSNRTFLVYRYQSIE